MVPLAGCSQELLDLLCQVIDETYESDDPFFRSESHLRKLRSLEFRLRGLEQRVSGISNIDDGNVGSTEHKQQVAKLFQLATLIYLLRVAKGDDRASLAVVEVLNEAFSTMDLLQKSSFCERPWPLFVIGLEAATEEERRDVLNMIGKALDWQPLGAMALVKRMVQDAWVLQDLHQNAGRCQSEYYGEIISRNRVPPCFT